MKENSHIYFAKKLIDTIDNKKISNVLEENIDYYYLGTIFPDIFYYTKETTFFSDMIHGKDGNSTNELIFKFLERAKKSQSKKDLAFVLGYITHCGFDTVMHPVIYYLTGNYYHKDKNIRALARLNHRKIECLWDDLYVGRDILQETISPKCAANLQVENILGEYSLPELNLVAVYRKHKVYNYFFRSRLVFYMASLANKIGIISKKEDLGVFYAINKKSATNMNKIFAYKDVITGKSYEASLGSLIKESESLTLNLLNAAFEYYEDTISKKTARGIIDGASLDTGRVDCPVTDIKYTI